MATPGSAPVSAGATRRLAFIDNLRWLMIVFVVTLHAGVTYSNLGSWYYIERPQPGPLTLFLLATYQAWLQAFFMGFLFFVAGYFVPGSLERKGPRRFMAERFRRLGIPSLIYMFAVHPFLVYAMLGPSWNPPAPAFPRAYVSLYLARWRFLSGTGPMWFAVALLFFTGVYVMAARRARKGSGTWVPSDRHAALLALGIAGCTFLVRIVQPIGTAVYNMQLCFFSQYIVLFWLGIAAYRNAWLERIPYAFGMRWMRIALIGGGAVWIALIGLGGGSQNMQAYVGGMKWQSAAACLWESFVCVGMSLGLIVLFRERFNSQGRFAALLSANAFAVYMFHPPILVAISLWLRGWHAAPLAKFAVAGTLAVVASYLLSEFVFRRVPGLKRVL